MAALNFLFYTALIGLFSLLVLPWVKRQKRSYDTSYIGARVLICFFIALLTLFLTNSFLTLTIVTLLSVLFFFHLDGRRLLLAAAGAGISYIRAYITHQIPLIETRTTYGYYFLILAIVGIFLPGSGLFTLCARYKERFVLWIDRLFLNKKSASMISYPLLVLFLVVLVAVIVGPFLSSGYFMKVDTLVTPHPRYIDPSGNFFLIPALSHLMQGVIPMWLFWQVLVIGYFFLLGRVGYRLAKLADTPLTGIVFALLLMTCNPLVYSRFLDGQINVYRFIALLPLWLLTLHQHFSSSSYTRRKTTLWLTLLAGVCMGISLHASFLLVVSYLIFAIVYAGMSSISRKKIIIPPIGMLLASLYVLIPTLQSDVSSLLYQNIDTQHFNAFATYGGDVGVVLNTLSLHGYRGEVTGRFVPSYGHNPKRFSLFLVLLGVVCVGRWGFNRTINRTRHHPLRARHTALTITAIVAFILALSVSSEVSVIGKMNLRLLNHVPYYNGFREPHKWMVLVLPFYVFYGAQGIATLVRLWYAKTSRGIFETGFIGLLIALPMLYTPMILRGFQGQVRLRDYPIEWYLLAHRWKYEKPPVCNINKSISSRCYDLLALPRHSYLQVGRAGGNILHPVDPFFASREVLSAQNVEMGEIYAQSSLPEQQFLDTYFITGLGTLMKGSPTSGDITTLVDYLHQLGIRDILVIKQAVDFTAHNVRLQKAEKMGIVKKSFSSPSLLWYRVLSKDDIK